MFMKITFKDINVCLKQKIIVMQGLPVIVGVALFKAPPPKKYAIFKNLNKYCVVKYEILCLFSENFIIFGINVCYLIAHTIMLED